MSEAASYATHCAGTLLGNRCGGVSNHVGRNCIASATKPWSRYALALGTRRLSLGDHPVDYGRRRRMACGESDCGSRAVSGMTHSRCSEQQYPDFSSDCIRAPLIVVFALISAAAFAQADAAAEAASVPAAVPWPAAIILAIVATIALVLLLRWVARSNESTAPCPSPPSKDLTFSSLSAPPNAIPGDGAGFAGNLVGGFAAGAGIAAGEEVARHLLGLSEYEAGMTPSEHAHEHSGSDDHLGGDRVGVSERKTSDDDVSAPQGDDWS